MSKMNIHEHLNPRETWMNCFDHNSVNSDPISIKKIAAWSWEAGQLNLHEVRHPNVTQIRASMTS
jgi:hypothetical protein